MRTAKSKQQREVWEERRIQSEFTIFHALISPGWTRGSKWAPARTEKELQIKKGDSKQLLTLKDSGGESSLFFFSPFSHVPAPKQYHRGYTGGSNSVCNRDPQRLKLRDRNLPLQFQELCDLKKEEPTSTAFFFFNTPVAWYQTGADSH